MRSFLTARVRSRRISSFITNYLDRFGKHPGFAGLTTFDATNTVLDAIEQQAVGQSLKQSLLARKAFAGTQVPVVFDAFGDASHETF